MVIRLAGLAFDFSTDSPVLRAHLAPFVTEAAEDEEVIALTAEELGGLKERLKKSESQRNDAYLEEMALLWAVNNQLMKRDGFFLHAAVVSLNQKAVAFTAPSGTGKTTHARLWLKCFGSRAKMLNGDKPFIRRIDGVWTAFPNPWNGKEGMGGHESAPLRALCFLERSATGNRIRPIRKDEAFSKLFNQTVIPESADGVATYLTNINRLINEIPCYLLSCDQTDEAVRTAWEGIFAAETA